MSPMFCFPCSCLMLLFVICWHICYLFSCFVSFNITNKKTKNKPIQTATSDSEHSCSSTSSQIFTVASCLSKKWLINTDVGFLDHWIVMHFSSATLTSQIVTDRPSVKMLSVNSNPHIGNQFAENYMPFATQFFLNKGWRFFCFPQPFIKSNY